MPQVSDNTRSERATPDHETKPSGDEILKYIRDAEDAEHRSKLIATIITITSIVIAAAVAGLLAHDNVIVTVLIFIFVCLLSVRLILKFIF